MGGGFTTLDPNSRRIVPEANGRTVVKVVYTVLESQYQSSLNAAVQSINATSDKVCFEIIGYLLEELRDAKNYASFQADVANANIFIGSLIFIEELAEKVRAGIVAASSERVAQQTLPSCVHPQPLDTAHSTPLLAPTLHLTHPTPRWWLQCSRAATLSTRALCSPPCRRSCG